MTKIVRIRDDIAKLLDNLRTRKEYGVQLQLSYSQIIELLVAAYTHQHK